MADVRKVEIRVVRSDGQEFHYQSNNWGVTKLEGVDFTPIEIFTAKRGFGDGDIITGKRKTARDITIVAKSKSAARNYLDRDKAIGFHNSNFTYDIYFTYMGRTRIAYGCELQGAKCPSGNVYARQELTVSYLCPQPDLYGAEAEAVDLNEVNAKWSFPRHYTQGSSLVFGTVVRPDEIQKVYTGTEPAPLRVVITANGLVENINIVVGTKELHIDCVLNDGDVMVIDADERYITINEEYISGNNYSAEVLQDLVLIYGTNIIKIYADDVGNTAFEVSIITVGRYGGL